MRARRWSTGPRRKVESRRRRWRRATVLSLERFCTRQAWRSQGGKTQVWCRQQWRWWRLDPTQTNRLTPHWRRPPPAFEQGISSTRVRLPFPAFFLSFLSLPRIPRPRNSVSSPRLITLCTDSVGSRHNGVPEQGRRLMSTPVPDALDVCYHHCNMFLSWSIRIPFQYIHSPRHHPLSSIFFIY